MRFFRSLLNLVAQVGLLILQAAVNDWVAAF
jgi:hypothetical protein